MRINYDAITVLMCFVHPFSSLTYIDSKDNNRIDLEAVQSIVATEVVSKPRGTCSGSSGTELCVARDNSGCSGGPRVSGYYGGGSTARCSLRNRIGSPITTIRVAGPAASGRSAVNRLPAVPLSSPPFLPCLPEIDYHFHVNGNYSPAREAVWRNANFLLLTDLVSTASVSSRLLPHQTLCRSDHRIGSPPNTILGLVSYSGSERFIFQSDLFSSLRQLFKQGGGVNSLSLFSSLKIQGG